MLDLVITDSKKYNSLKKDYDTLYFLEDINEIYKGTECYTKSIFLVNDFPNLGIKDNIYIKKITLEVRVWNGESWNTIIPRIYTSLEDGKYCDGLVTGNAIKHYITEKLIEFEKKSGNIDKIASDNVILSKDIRINVDIGSYKKGDIIKKNTSLTDILTKTFIINTPPVYIDPILNIRLDSKLYEVGSIISPVITADFQRNDAGELYKYNLDKIQDNDITTLISNPNIVDYKENPFMINNKEIEYVASIKYHEGIIKKDDLGNDYEKGHILSGSLFSKMIIKGVRKLFYGSKNNVNNNIDSNYIRSLSNNILNPDKNLNFKININEGDIQITIAYPDILPELHQIYSHKLNLNIIEAFNYSKVFVEGANEYNPILYKVYNYIGDISYINNDIFDIKFIKGEDANE